MENKVIFLLVFSVLLLSIFSGVVSAYSLDEAKDDLRYSWNDYIGGGGDNDIFIKILLLIMISLLVFSIIDSVGIFGNQNKAALFVISLVVGILSTYYMNTLDVYNIATIYSAFGGALVTVVPFLILGSFTMRAVIDGNVQLMVIQHIAWGMFAAFMLYNIFFLPDKTNWVFWMAAGLAGTLTIANTFVLDYFNKTVLKGKVIKSASSMRDISAGAEILKALGKK